MFDLKKQLRWAQVKVGIIISLALVILFLSVFFAGSINKLLHPKVEIKAAMRDVKGLKKAPRSGYTGSKKVQWRISALIRTTGQW